MEAKEFNNFVRPNVELVTCIVHGHSVVVAVSEQWVRKDSSAIPDILLHSLGRLTENGVVLRHSEIICQAISCGKESGKSRSKIPTKWPQPRGRGRICRTRGRDAGREQRTTPAG